MNRLSHSITFLTNSEKKRESSKRKKETSWTLYQICLHVPTQSLVIKTIPTKKNSVFDLMLTTYQHTDIKRRQVHTTGHFCLGVYCKTYMEFYSTWSTQYL